MFSQFRSKLIAMKESAASGQRVVPIVPTAADPAGLGANFMNRSERRAAFEAAARTAPGTVRAALQVGPPNWLADSEVDA
jgi:NTE family protein